MKEFKDQMNNTIRLETTPRRIVSLVPSQTQLLHFLGLNNEVVGLTKFCIHPSDWFGSKQRVGGTKSVNIELVRSLKPDLIIGNKEENKLEDILALESVAPVWMSDIYNLDDALHMIGEVGEMTGKSVESQALVEEIQAEFRALDIYSKTLSIYGDSVLYFIWKAPDMTAGVNTFIDDMLMRCGLVNAKTEERYPLATGEEQPELVLLSSEPFPFKSDHILAFQKAYPNAAIICVDGEMFSWYGSNLMEAPKYFRNLLKQLAVNQ